MTAVAHGDWGERLAVKFLRREGLFIIDCNNRPVASDKRLEIDIIAYDKQSDVVVFVEVKQHSKLSPFQRRLRSINCRKKKNLRRACNAWRRVNKWNGAYRFDVIEVYGVPDGEQPVIDYIQNVELFAKPGRFVRWE